MRHAVLACRSPVRRSFFVWLPLRVSELFLDIGDEDFRKPDIKYLPPTEPRKGWGSFTRINGTSADSPHMVGRPVATLRGTDGDTQDSIGHRMAAQSLRRHGDYATAKLRDW